MLLVPELLYDMYLDLVYVKGIFDITFARTAAWGHVDHAAPPATDAPTTERVEVAS